MFFHSLDAALAGSLACLLLGCKLFCCLPSVVFQKVSPSLLGLVADCDCLLKLGLTEMPISLGLYYILVGGRW